jgi:hypothetical protein
MGDRADRRGNADMPLNSRNVEDRVKRMVERYRGRGGPLRLADSLGRDLGITDEDSIEFMEEIEEIFNIDLNPLVDSNTIYVKGNWIDRLMGRKLIPMAEISLGQLIDYINQAPQRSAG